jgi:hypothetical protein
MAATEGELMILHRRTSSGRLLVVVAASAAIAAVPLGMATQAASARPVAPAHAALHVTATVPIPGAVGHLGYVTAEASNGDVFIAVPKTSTTDAIEVIVGSHAPKVVATVPAGTVGIAVSPTQFFVAGRRAISSFDRTTDAFIRTWVVKVPATLGGAKPGVFGGILRYGDGRLWALGSTGGGKEVVEINPASASITVVGSGKNVFDLAVGPRGVYFVHTGGHTLVRVAANGTKVTKPTHEAVSETLSGPAALQVIAVNGNTLLISHDAGQGLDAGLLRYNATTLARLSEAGTSVFHTDVVPTVVGDLVLFNQTTGEGCSTKAHPVCIAPISTTTAKTGPGVALPTGSALSVLHGPFPAVIVRHGSGSELLRVR